MPSLMALRIFKDLTIIILLSYGLLHTSYKYGLPDLANRDFYRYNKMIDAPLDMQATEAHFVLRQVPTYVAYLLKQAGVYYANPEIAFRSSQYYKTENDQRNFFALILSNYLALAAGLLIIVTYLRRYGDGKLFTVMALATGYFLVPVSVIAPLAHGYAWLACVIATIGLLERKVTLMIAAGVISFFSRESVLMFFCPFIACLLLYDRNNRFLWGSLLLYGSLVVLFLLVQSSLAHEPSPLFTGSIVQQLPGYIRNGNFFSTTFLPQGVLVYLCYHLYRRARRLTALYIVSATVLLLACIASMILGPGRIIGETCPLLILLFCLPREKLQEFAAVRT